jgi:broad specificity phosphatase PhoE
MFECPSWYDGAFSFIPPNYLTRDRYFNVNPYYKPIYGDVDVKEDEKGFYHRSRFLVESIINAHKNRGGNILLSGHAGSIEAITRGMLQRSARPERLRHESNKVDYCNFAILDRDAYSGEWSVYLPESSEYPYGGQQLAQTSIPLYSASSQYLLTNRVRGAKTPRRSKSYRNSFHY